MANSNTEIIEKKGKAIKLNQASEKFIPQRLEPYSKSYFRHTFYKVAANGGDNQKVIHDRLMICTIFTDTWLKD